MSPIRTLVAVCSLVPLSALAEVGEVEVLDGAATRKPASGDEAALAVGSAIEVGDVLTVKSGTMALRLSDESVLALDEGSSLRIDEADFGDLDTEKFSARLLLGSLWAKVAPLVVGSGAKFEITTERAVAGVRGTEFTVEVAPETEQGYVIGVEEGEVAVDEVEVPPPPQADAQPAPVATGGAPVRRVPVILKPGKEWVYTRQGVLQRSHKIHSARLAKFIGKHKPMWKKRVLERVRERQAKLRLKEKELRAKQKAIRAKQNELRDKAKDVRRR